ncbi:MAG TPA: hypothetical protein VFJ98_02355 [Mycobacteriales bacterium]|nr:hypothetical protein [Mycobacteriales bacterium]
MSAVIYAAIVVMWAVVLVPMWLRRHDAATESRSVEKFSSAMRTLSRRTHATPGRRYVVMPRRQAGSVSVHVSGAAVAGAPVRPHARPTPSAARASMVRRRRRTALVIVGVAVLTLVLAVAGTLPWLVQLVADVVLVAFLAHLRVQAKRAAAVTRQRRRGTAAAARPASRPLSPPMRREAPGPAAEVAWPAAEPVPATAAGFADSTVDVTWSDDAAATALTIDVDVVPDETWEPVPVPPPTYTLKPPAPANGGTSYDDDATDELERVVDDEPTELDEILERRWAVND